MRRGGAITARIPSKFPSPVRRFFLRPQPRAHVIDHGPQPRVIAHHGGETQSQDVERPAVPADFPVKQRVLDRRQASSVDVDELIRGAEQQNFVTCICRRDSKTPA